MKKCYRNFFYYGFSLLVISTITYDQYKRQKIRKEAIEELDRHIEVLEECIYHLEVYTGNKKPTYPGYICMLDPFDEVCPCDTMMKYYEEKQKKK